MRSAEDLADRERGAILPLIAGMLLVLMGMAAFAVDYGWLFYNELTARKAAEAAALGGVVHMPLPDCVAPTAGTDPSTVALDIASRNHYADGVGAVGVGVAQGATCAQLTVTVTDTVETFFMRVFGYNTMEIRESATAEHLPTLKLGSDESFLGEDPDHSSGEDRNVNFWLAVNGDFTNKGQGDAFTAEHYGDHNTGSQGNNFERNQGLAGSGPSYWYAIEVPASHQGDQLQVQIYDPQVNPGNNTDDRELSSPVGANPYSDSVLRFRLFRPDDTPATWTDNNDRVCTRRYYHEDHANWRADRVDEWVNMCASQNAIQGVYVLDVRQTGDVDLLNGFSIRALVNGSEVNDIAIYGLGSMSTWMHEAGSAAKFKAVKLDDVYSGSRLILQLWDVGDIDGTGSIEFKGSLDGWDCEIRERNDHGAVTNDWHADDGAGCLEIISPEREHNNEWIDFAFDLEGFSCSGDACWATVQYNLPGTPHDRTTWTAFIDGQPIHLIP